MDLSASEAKTLARNSVVFASITSRPLAIATSILYHQCEPKAAPSSIDSSIWSCRFGAVTQRETKPPIVIFLRFYASLPKGGEWGHHDRFCFQ